MAGTSSNPWERGWMETILLPGGGSTQKKFDIGACIIYGFEI